MQMRKLDLLSIVCACVLFVAGCAAQATATPLPPTPTAMPPSPTLAAPTALPAPVSVEPPDVLRSYVDAFNRGDASAVMALFADEDLNYVDVGYLETNDRNAVLKYTEWLFGKQTTLTVEDCTFEGETWRCTLGVRDDCQGAFPDLDKFHNTLMAKLKDGKIQIWITSMIPAERQMDQEVGTVFIGWVQANRPKDMAKLMGKAYDRVGGELWSEVCKAYIATLK